MGRKLEASAAMVAMATAASVHGQTRVIYVDQSAPSGGDGGSWETAFTNLYDACEAANALTEVRDFELRIAQGTHRPRAGDSSGTWNFAPRPTASGATLRILGSFAGRRSETPDSRDFVATRTVLNGDVLGDDQPDGTRRDDNVTSMMRIGWSSDRMWTRRLILDGLEFSHAGSRRVIAGGEALYIYTNAAFECVVSNCVFRDNEVCAAQLNPDYSISFRDCLFVSNYSNDFGGAIQCSYNLSTSRCSFIGNQSALDGGAIYKRGLFGSGYTSIAYCEFRENRAGRSGGAVFSVDSTLSISNCLLAGNAAASIGGAAYSAGEMHVDQSTLSGNSAPWAPSMFSRGDAEIGNSVLARSNHQTVSADCIITEGTLTLSRVLLPLGPDSVMLGVAGNLSISDARILAGSPHFRDAAGPDDNEATTFDNDYHLASRSSAIDAATDHAWLVDLDGNPRKVPGLLGRPPLPDLGCYESQITLCPADMDADDAVGVDDLVIYLRAFEDGDLLADIVTSVSDTRPNNAVTIDDLVYFLSRFEAGC